MNYAILLPRVRDIHKKQMQVTQWIASSSTADQRTARIQAVRSRLPFWMSLANVAADEAVYKQCCGDSDAKWAVMQQDIASISAANTIASPTTATMSSVSFTSVSTLPSTTSSAARHPKPARSDAVTAHSVRHSVRQSQRKRGVPEEAIPEPTAQRHKVDVPDIGLTPTGMQLEDLIETPRFEEYKVPCSVVVANNPDVTA